jgi:transcriptional regulator NrdR family protein
VVEMDGLKVRKRNGGLQDFDRQKIANSIAKAGGLLEQAEDIAVQVENWAQGTAVDNVIASSAIRTKVLELLRISNPEAAEGYEQYRKFR